MDKGTQLFTWVNLGGFDACVLGHGFVHIVAHSYDQGEASYVHASPSGLSLSWEAVQVTKRWGKYGILVGVVERDKETTPIVGFLLIVYTCGVTWWLVVDNVKIWCETCNF